MARYSKVDRLLWNDTKFRSLSDDAKLVFLFVLLHPHMTSLGAMRASIHGLAVEMGWEGYRFLRAVDTVSSAGILEYDEANFYVGLPNFLEHNRPANSKVVKGWASVLDLIPECELKYKLVQRVTDFLKPFPKSYRQAWDTVSIRYPRVEKPGRETVSPQKQEQEHIHSGEKPGEKPVVCVSAAPVQKPEPEPSQDEQAEADANPPDDEPGREAVERFKTFWLKATADAGIPNYHWSPEKDGKRTRELLRSFRTEDARADLARRVRAFLSDPDPYMRTEAGYGLAVFVGRVNSYANKGPPPAEGVEHQEAERQRKLRLVYGDEFAAGRCGNA